MRDTCQIDPNLCWTTFFFLICISWFSHGSAKRCRTKCEILPSGGSTSWAIFQWCHWEFWSFSHAEPCWAMLSHAESLHMFGICWVYKKWVSAASRRQELGGGSMVDPCPEPLALHQPVQVPGLSHHLHRGGGPGPAACGGRRKVSEESRMFCSSTWLSDEKIWYYQVKAEFDDKLVGALEHVLFFHILGVLGFPIIPTDELIFLRWGFQPPPKIKCKSIVNHPCLGIPMTMETPNLILAHIIPHKNPINIPMIIVPWYPMLSH